MSDDKSSKFKAAVFFDFDCTITISHYFHFRNNLGYYAKSKNWSQLFNNAVAKYGLDAVKKASELADRKSATTQSIYLDLFFGGESGLAERVKFLKSLVENNCDLYISSKGDCSQIREILDMFDLTPYFVAINSADYERDNTGCIVADKNVFISNIMQHSLWYHTVFFVDDDPDQHQILKTVIKKPYIYFGQMVEKYNTDKLNPELYQVIHDMTPINFGLNKDNNGLSPAMMQIMSNHIVDWNQSTLKTIADLISLQILKRAARNVPKRKIQIANYKQQRLAIRAERKKARQMAEKQAGQRKPSEYNLFIKRFAIEHKGQKFPEGWLKAAAAAYRRAGLGAKKKPKTCAEKHAKVPYKTGYGLYECQYAQQNERKFAGLVGRERYTAVKRAATKQWGKQSKDVRMSYVKRVKSSRK